jgi:hypothetical protein
VVHLAASISVAESMSMPKKYYDNNLDGSRRVLSWAVAQGAKHMVAASSAAIYGDVAESDIPIKVPTCTPSYSTTAPTPTTNRPPLGRTPPSAGGAAVRRQEPLRRLQVHDRRRPSRGLSYRRSNGPPTALERPSNGSLNGSLNGSPTAGTRWRSSCGNSRTSSRCAARRCASSTCTARARCEGDPREPRALAHPPMSSTHKLTVRHVCPPRQDPHNPYSGVISMFMQVRGGCA